MIQNSVKAEILRAVAGGSSFAQAGAALNISTTRARTAVFTLCRKMKLSVEADDIQAQPEKYLQALKEFERKPQFELRGVLVDKLSKELRLRSAADLTPQYLSNITASQLISRGVTLVAIAELQEWLERHDLSLKRRPPETDSEVREVQRAIALLNAFHFNTDALEAQLENLIGDESDSDS